MRKVNFQTDIESVVADSSPDYGGVDYAPGVREAWDSTAENPKWVIVNNTTYDSPNNTNRWRILYRVKMQLGTFKVSYYTRYTIRARFYANKQGGPNPPSTSSFTPNKHAKGYDEADDGLGD